MKRFRAMMVVFALIALGASLAATKADAAGTTGGVFLGVGVGARPEGMGGAGVALADDANSVQINAAGMTQIPHQQISLMHNEYLLDIKQEYISYVMKHKANSAFGASLVYLDLGTQSSYSTSNVYINSFSSNNYALTFAYATKASEEISWGAGLKFLREKIGGSSGSAVALDGGVIYAPKGSPFRYGATLQNLGTKIKVGKTAEDLPLSLKLGAAWRMPARPLTVAGDVYFIRGNSAEFHLGGEYILSNMIALRIGYNTADDLDNGFTFGIGVSHQNFAIDYAFVPMGFFGDSHRFSFTANF